MHPLQGLRLASIAKLASSRRARLISRQQFRAPAAHWDISIVKLASRNALSATVASLQLKMLALHVRIVQRGNFQELD
jgi:hypothetical protein